MVKLIVFDLDQTLLMAPEFHRKHYSGSLDAIVEEMRGLHGLDVLRHCREHYEGHGELALLALNIPFGAWAERVIDAPLDLIEPQPDLVTKIRALHTQKVVYTGSAKRMALRILERLGFSERDFDLVLGWEKPEVFPVKWSCSPRVFELILARFNCKAQEALSVGDSWATDLEPAQALGMQTVEIGNKSGKADQRFSTIHEFLKQGGIE